jgi:hypothetical protein
MAVTNLNHLTGHDRDPLCREPPSQRGHFDPLRGIFYIAQHEVLALRGRIAA